MIKIGTLMAFFAMFLSGFCANTKLPINIIMDNNEQIIIKEIVWNKNINYEAKHVSYFNTFFRPNNFDELKQIGCSPKDLGAKDKYQFNDYKKKVNEIETEIEGVFLLEIDDKAFYWFKYKARRSQGAWFSCPPLVFKINEDESLCLEARINLKYPLISDLIMKIDVDFYAYLFDDVQLDISCVPKENKKSIKKELKKIKKSCFKKNQLQVSILNQKIHEFKNIEVKTILSETIVANITCNSKEKLRKLWSISHELSEIHDVILLKAESFGMVDEDDYLHFTRLVALQNYKESLKYATEKIGSIHTEELKETMIEFKLINPLAYECI